MYTVPPRSVLFSQKKILRSLLVVFLLWLFFSPVAAFAGSLVFSPREKEFSVGSTFSVTVQASGGESAFNAVSGVVSFSPELLEVVSVSKASSIVSLWVQEPIFSNAQGSVSFEGIILNPGYTGTGKVLSITFRAKSEGEARLAFVRPSVLANDGSGTELLSSSGSAYFTLSQKTDVVDSVPSDLVTDNAKPAPASLQQGPNVTIKGADSSQWIGESNAVFLFELSPEDTALRLLLNDSSTSIPTVLYEPAVSEREIADIPEGISYLHVQSKKDSEWGGVTHFEVKRDSTVPEVPEIHFHHKEQHYVAIVSIHSSDSLSGIARIELSLDEGPFLEVGTEDTLVHVTDELSAGAHTLIVRSYDRAGNMSEKSETFEIAPVASQDLPQEIRSTEKSIISKNNTSIVVFLLILCFLLLHLFLIIAYIYRQYKNKVFKETKEALEVVTQSLSGIMAEIEDALKMYEKGSETKKLSTREKSMLRKLRKNIDEASRVIQREVTDIIQK